VTYAVDRLRRWRSRPIWLCKQVIEACIGLTPGPTDRSVLLDDVSDRASQ
jgi:hypothetical protein